MSVPFRSINFFIRRANSNSGHVEVHQTWTEAVLKHLPGNDTESPIIFRIDNNGTGMSLYVGIKKWHNELGEENVAYLPEWIIVSLGLDYDRPINLVPTTLPKASYIKINGFTNFVVDCQCRDDLLEIALREHPVINIGQTVNIDEYIVAITEIKDSDGNNVDAACILNVDLAVDFDRPVDYVTPPPSPSPPPPAPEPDGKFVPFSGKGYKLN